MLRVGDDPLPAGTLLRPCSPRCAAMARRWPPLVVGLALLLLSVAASSVVAKTDQPDGEPSFFCNFFQTFHSVSSLPIDDVQGWIPDCLPSLFQLLL